MLSPLREAGMHIPSRPLTRQEAWKLANAASGLASQLEDEMLDPWDA